MDGVSHPPDDAAKHCGCQTEKKRFYVETSTAVRLLTGALSIELKGRTKHFLSHFETFC